MKQGKIILLMMCSMFTVIVSPVGFAENSMLAPANANLKCASSKNIMNCFHGADSQTVAQNTAQAMASNTFDNHDLQQFPKVRDSVSADINYRHSGYGTQASGAVGQSSVPSNVNSNQFTNSGPFSLGYRYDQHYKSMIYGAYSYMFNPSIGLALKGDFGTMEHRINATVGFAMSPHQQIKLTYEFLAQKMPFSFVTGKVNEWMHQNALGGAYRYLFDSSWLQSVSVNASYVKADSKSLSTIVYTGSNNLLYDDIRHIAGGTERALDTAVTIIPMHHLFLTLGVGYSTLKYNTLKTPQAASIRHLDNNKNYKTMDYSAKATDILSSSFKTSVSGAHNASGNVYGASLSHIFGHAFEATMSGRINRGHGHLKNDHSMLLSVSYPAPNAYSAAARRTMSSLQSWIKTPVVYETQVLAVKDEVIKEAAVPVSSSTIPDQTVSPVDVDGRLLQAASSARREIIPVNFAKYFHENPSQWDAVHYKVSIEPNGGYGQATNNGGNCSGSGLPVLGLTCVANTPYGATLKSSQAVPLQAAKDTNYTITVAASFIRNGRAMQHKTEVFHIYVVKSNKSKPSFKVGFTLPTAYKGNNSQLSAVSDKYRIDLAKDINNPSGSGDLKVTASGLPDGLSLTGTVISGTVSSLVKEGSYPVHFVLSNLAGGKNPVTQTLKVAAMPAIQWAKPVVLPATVDVASTVTIDLLKSGYVTESDKKDTVTFGTKSKLPAWIQLSAAGKLVIHPKSNVDVSQLKNIVFTATSKLTGQVIDSQSQSMSVEFYAKQPPASASSFGDDPANSAAYVVRGLQPSKMYTVKGLAGTASGGTVVGYYLITGNILTGKAFITASEDKDPHHFFAGRYPFASHQVQTDANGNLTVFLSASSTAGSYVTPQFTTVRVAAVNE